MLCLVHRLVVQSRFLCNRIDRWTSNTAQLTDWGVSVMTVKQHCCSQLTTWQVFTAFVKLIDYYCVTNRWDYTRVLQHNIDMMHPTQRLFNMVLSDLSDCEAYLENVVIYFDPCQTPGKTRTIVSAALWKKRTLNLAKCEFSQAYLWNLLVQGGRLLGRQACPWQLGLSMLTVLKHFLERAEYCQEFCNNFALVAPFSDFVGPKVKFGWIDDASMLFHRSKISLAGLLSLKDVICH